MSPRRLLPLPLLLLIAGCGGATSAPDPSTPPARESAPAGAAKALVVGGTDLRLGGAEADDGTGARRLAGPSRPDPSSLKDRGRRKDGVGAGDSCANQDVLPTADNVAQTIASTLCLLNGQRADAGLGPLSEDGRLAQAAIAHSREMVDRSYFSHTGADGTSSTDRIRASGYISGDRAWTVGENLAWGTGNLATPRSIVAAWMNSPGHRENILRPVYNQIGFGVVTGNPSRADGQGATYTTTFGSLGGAAAPAEPAVVAEVPDATAAAPATGQARRAVKSARKSSAARRAKRKRARAARARSARVKSAHKRSVKARVAKGPR